HATRPTPNGGEGSGGGGSGAGLQLGGAERAAAVGGSRRAGTTGERGGNRLAVDGLVRDEVDDQAVERIAMLAEERERALLGFLQQRRNLFVDDLLRRLRVVAP